MNADRNILQSKRGLRIRANRLTSTTLSLLMVMLVLMLFTVSETAAQDLSKLIPLTLENAGDTTIVYLGITIGATPCIDSQLGESELPPVPAAGKLDLRFNERACLGNGVEVDWHPYASLFNGNDTFHLKVQMKDPNATSASISWSSEKMGFYFRAATIEGGGLKASMLTDNVLTWDPSSVTVSGLRITTLADCFDCYSQALLISDRRMVFPPTTVDDTVGMTFGTSIEAVSNMQLDELTITNPAFTTDLYKGMWILSGYATHKVFYKPSHVGGDSGFIVIQSAASTSPDTIRVYGEGRTVAGVGQKNQPDPGFTLFPNYPNPFNPTTTISYQIPERGRVHISVFSVLGEQVAELLNAVQDAGEHSIVWDGGVLPSGVYFAHIRITSMEQRSRLFTATQTLILSK